MGAEIWQWLNENSGAVSAVATVVAALIAAFALVSAASDSQQRSRPMVSAEHRLAPHSDTSIQLLVKNYGPSAATKVRITFDPEIPDNHGTSPVILRYQSEITALNPGQELANTWLIPRYEQNKYAGNVYDFPDEVNVKIKYRGGWHRYRTNIRLNVSVVLHSSASVSSDSMLGTAREIRKQMTAIAAHTKSIAESHDD